MSYVYTALIAFAVGVFLGVRYCRLVAVVMQSIINRFRFSSEI